VSDLQEKVASSQSEISSLQEHIDKRCVEKLALMHKVRVLKNNLGNREKDVEELRAEASRQSDRYDELWRAHGVLLEEAQKLRSQVIILNLGVRVESAGDWLGSGSRDPEGPSFRLRSLSRQSGRATSMLEASAAGARNLRDGRKNKVVVAGGAK